MIGSGGTPARAARIAGVACALQLVAGCAGFTESTRSPPGVDVPEPGAHGASAGARRLPVS